MAQMGNPFLDTLRGLAALAQLGGAHGLAETTNYYPPAGPKGAEGGFIYVDPFEAPEGYEKFSHPAGFGAIGSWDEEDIAPAFKRIMMGKDFDQLQAQGVGPELQRMIDVIGAVAGPTQYTRPSTKYQDFPDVSQKANAKEDVINMFADIAQGTAPARAGFGEGGDIYHYDTANQDETKKLGNIYDMIQKSMTGDATMSGLTADEAKQTLAQDAAAFQQAEDNWRQFLAKLPEMSIMAEFAGATGSGGSKSPTHSLKLYDPETGEVILDTSGTAEWVDGKYQAAQNEKAQKEWEAMKPKDRAEKQEMLDFNTGVRSAVAGLMGAAPENIESSLLGSEIVESVADGLKGESSRNVLHAANQVSRLVKEIGPERIDEHIYDHVMQRLSMVESGKMDELPKDLRIYTDILRSISGDLEKGSRYKSALTETYTNRPPLNTFNKMMDAYIQVRAMDMMRAYNLNDEEMEFVMGKPSIPKPQTTASAPVVNVSEPTYGDSPREQLERAQAQGQRRANFLPQKDAFKGLTDLYKSMTTNVTGADWRRPPR